MKDLVTVVIPVYNTETYLDICVSSVVGQTYQNLQILLIDDGSTDASPRICDEWAGRDSRVTVIHKQNEGLGMARNTGMDCLSVAWGFRSEEILRAAGATTILRTPQELKKAVLG